MLDAPASEEELYLDRGEIDPYRPVCQGDVFPALAIPGRDEPCMAMVLSHPCAMRAGPRLRPRITVVPVTPFRRVPLGEWQSQHYRTMPLPDLGVDPDAAAHAAMLEEPATISSDLLDPARRVAPLTDKGIMLLQQRYIHNHSRFVAPLPVLQEVSAAVLEEVELQESWNLALAAPQIQAGADPSIVLEQQADEFDALMRSLPSGYGSSLRDLLQDPSARATVRRLVEEAIAQRGS